MITDRLENRIRDLAHTNGIDALGFAEASPFHDYLLEGSKRRDPKLSLPGARSIIVAGIYIGGVTLSNWTDPWVGRTSRLFLSGFFITVVKPLEPIAVMLNNEGYQAIICKDGSILPLKLAAIRAGFGWQGKHTLLISKKFGTFLALGGIITDAELTHNAGQEPDHCGTCDRCQTACPLGALDQPYVLHRERCMSNLLQEDNLPDRVGDAIENRIVDCEICQQVCPWNRKHLDNPLATSMTESFQEELEDWERFFHLAELAGLSERDYDEKLGHLGADIPYPFFHRNVKNALRRAKREEVAQI